MKLVLLDNQKDWVLLDNQKPLTLEGHNNKFGWPAYLWYLWYGKDKMDIFFEHNFIRKNILLYGLNIF